jgi:hypothetical protein
MSVSPLPTLTESPAPLARIVEKICTQFEESWAAGGRPAIEDQLAEAPAAARSVRRRLPGGGPVADGTR